MGAFGYCSFASFVLPDSLTSIEYGLFTNCDFLSNVVIPNSVTNIDDYAFGYCDALEVIVIPESITGIHELAFQDTFFSTIKGVSGSYAESFANLRGYTFVAMWFVIMKSIPGRVVSPLQSGIFFAFYWHFFTIILK